VSEPVVVFDKVSKKFIAGERHDSLRDLIPAIVHRFVRPKPPDQLEGQEFWALRDVSFDVARGEALGIIGPNGAGKSTTLKLLTRIMRPTIGSCDVRGRVGALIEVAAGFHPDLTGRENIFLQGAIMGMRRSEIVSKMDAIIDFAGVARFVDTPVKRYSSGMNARLGFSIAAHLEPDALIIDEVLSVGDMAFQQRCVDRMREYKARGVTIVFVSHNLHAVAELCDRALYLAGTVRALGPTSDVIAQYVRSDFSSTSGDGEAVRVLSAELVDEHGLQVDQVDAGARLTLRVTYEARRPLNDVEFGITAYRSTDIYEVYHANYSTHELGLGHAGPAGRFAVDFSFRANLVRGPYFVGAHVFEPRTHSFLSRLTPAAYFNVLESRTRNGLANLELEVDVHADAPGDGQVGVAAVPGAESGRRR